jgi:hypothetical protein
MKSFDAQVTTEAVQLQARDRLPVRQTAGEAQAGACFPGRFHRPSEATRRVGLFHPKWRGACGNGSVCVYSTMNTNKHSDSHDNTAGLRHRAVDALFGMVALVALVGAFAVEFAPISPVVQQAAHKLLHVGQTADSAV